MISNNKDRNSKQELQEDIRDNVHILSNVEQEKQLEILHEQILSIKICLLDCETNNSFSYVSPLLMT